MRRQQSSTSFLKYVIAGTLILAVSCQQAKRLDPREKIPGNEPGDNPSDPDSIAYPESHTVVIVGDGFDMENAAYKDQIAGAYTLNCDYEKYSRLPFRFSDTDSQLNNSVLDWYRNDNTGCTLSEGIELKPETPFEPILDLRSSWNDGLGKKPFSVNVPELEKVKSVLHQEKSWRNFAGTALAGLVTYGNPKVRIVLVQINPEMFSDFEDISAGDCPVPEYLPRLATTLRDKNVRQTYIETAPGEAENALFGLITKHEATMVLSAFSQAESAELNSRLTAGGCPTSSLTSLFSAFIDLDFERLRHRSDNSIGGNRLPLVIAPAGNSQKNYDEANLLRHCNATEFHRLQVGSYGRDKVVMELSPRGACIDYYLPGELILVEAPYAFKNAVSGTDISSGLLANYIAKNFDPKVPPELWLEELEKQRDTEKLLAEELFPTELFLQIAGASTTLIEPLNRQEYLNRAQLPFDFKSLKPLPFPW